MTVAFKSPVTSANVNAKFISRTDNQNASGVINFVNGIEIAGVEVVTLPTGGTTGQVLSKSSSADFDIEWANVTAGARSFRAASTTDSITTADDTVSYSGASFTATLPTAVGNSGKRITLIHAGTSLTQVYTIATTSSQTVGGYSSGSYKLSTQGETLTVESNGTNWEVVDHYAQTDWSSTYSITITGTTTNPTKPTGVSVDEVTWMRSGRMMRLRGVYRQTNNTSGNNGSGDYLFGIIPSGAEIDTSDTGTYTTVEGWNGYFDLSSCQSVGQFALGATDAYITGGCAVYSTTQVRFFGIALGAAGFFASGLGYFTTTSNPAWFNFDILVPISGWQP